MPAHKKSISKRIITSLIAIVVCLSIANIIVSATVSSKGEKLRLLEEQARNLRHENQILEQQIVSTRSLTKLQYQAKEMGFVERPKMIMIADDATVARVIDSREL